VTSAWKTPLGARAGQLSANSVSIETPVQKFFERCFFATVAESKTPMPTHDGMIFQTYIPQAVPLGQGRAKIRAKWIDFIESGLYILPVGQLIAGLALEMYYQLDRINLIDIGE
jgi:hypothetical protein